ncbi:hypothetical protein SO802_017709 [Lithocarpus litseifolius]|uniref:Uncharacterized protein n=1 Tax=Lithocarpus litseifolius TaxID=425828 RepID=A0AAW2CJ92_9ROSI
MLAPLSMTNAEYQLWRNGIPYAGRLVNDLDYDEFNYDAYIRLALAHVVLLILLIFHGWSKLMALMASLGSVLWDPTIKEHKELIWLARNLKLELTEYSCKSIVLEEFFDLAHQLLGIPLAMAQRWCMLNKLNIRMDLGQNPRDLVEKDRGYEHPFPLISSSNSRYKSWLATDIRSVHREEEVYQKSNKRKRTD